MEPISVVSALLNSKTLQKPFVFVSMSIACLFFSTFGALMIWFIIKEAGSQDSVAYLDVMIGIGLGLLFIFMGLVSGYLVYRCFDGRKKTRG